MAHKKDYPIKDYRNNIAATLFTKRLIFAYIIYAILLFCVTSIILVCLYFGYTAICPDEQSIIVNKLMNLNKNLDNNVDLYVRKVNEDTKKRNKRELHVQNIKNQKGLYGKMPFIEFIKKKSEIITKDNQNKHENNNNNNFVHSINSIRYKRDLVEIDKQLNPIYHYDSLLSQLNKEEQLKFVREKRIAEHKLQKLEEKVINCRKSTIENQCDAIYAQFVTLKQEIDEKFTRMASILQNMNIHQTDGSQNLFRADNEKRKSEGTDKSIEHTKEKKKDLKKQKKKKDKLNKKDSSEESSEENKKQLNDTLTDDKKVPPLIYFGLTTKRPMIYNAELEQTTQTTQTTILKKNETVPEAHSVSDLKDKIQPTHVHNIAEVKPENISTDEKLPDKTKNKPFDKLSKVINILDQPDATTISSSTTAQIATTTEFDITENIVHNVNWRHPKIHEDLHEDFLENNWNKLKEPSPLEQFMHYKSKNRVSNYDEVNFKDNLVGSDADKTGNSINNKNLDLIGASGPFISLCEEIAKKNSKHQTQPSQVPIPIHTIPLSNFGGQIQTLIPHQFTGRGPMHIPVTGETMKASSQVIMNPSFGNYMPYPFCYYVVPGQQFRTTHQTTGWPHMQAAFANGMGMFPNNQENSLNLFYKIVFPTSRHDERDTNKHGIDPRSRGYMYVPNQPANFVPTFSGIKNTNTGHGFVANNQNLRMTQPQSYYCSYLPGQNLQSYYHHPKSSNIQTNAAGYRSHGNNVDEELSEGMPKTVLASENGSTNLNNTLNTFPVHCEKGLIPCLKVNQCINIEQLCDSKVDCPDASDEIDCPCESKIAKSKICDGFSDCPNGSDEIGCFGCDRFSYSCYSGIKDYEKHKKSSLSMCYSFIEKCDGFENCINGYDERDCSIITKDLMPYSVGFTEGFLYRNYKGVWYPVCKNPMKWAKEACENEVGESIEDPMISYKSALISGPFIQPHSAAKTLIEIDLSEPVFVETCPKDKHHLENNVVLHVKCPQMKCGTVTLDKKAHAESFLQVINNQNDTIPRIKRTETRVVGGTDSEPLAWPFIIGLYRNGSFHCGGVIHTENWIISAAHCVEKYHAYYYEIRAGVLRRHSYSPMTQIIRVSFIVAHQTYDRAVMINDLALLRLSTPLMFNRWIRPICLPGPEITSDQSGWMWGPQPETICTAVGWGAIKEKGPEADALQEVELPIMKECKHVMDKHGEEICAGYIEGGRDSCQGDSGGPLFCKSVSDESMYYIAGIVSHGEGCARPDEPGVYTRVALFLDWIHQSESNGNIPHKTPHQFCSGTICLNGECVPERKRCDGHVDCLYADDERNCKIHQFVGSSKLNQTISNVVNSEIPSEVNHITQSETFIEIHNETTSKTIDLNNETKAAVRFVTNQPIINPDKLDITNFPLHREWELGDNNTNKYAELQLFNDTEAKLLPLKNITKLFLDIDKFVCTKILQTINLAHRCDRQIDCEDGTDELHCNCRDFLQNSQNGKFSNLICDGFVDCADFTDEEDCMTCKKDEFKCGISKKCIKRELKCNEKDDCEYKEDELDCVALTDGAEVELDENNRPKFYYQGVLTKNTNGQWKIVCHNEADLNKSNNTNDLVRKMCNKIGLSDYTFFNKTIMDDDHLKKLNVSRQSKNNPLDLIDIRKSTAKKPINKHILRLLDGHNIYKRENAAEKLVKQQEDCVTLYIECLPQSISGNHLLKPTAKNKTVTLKPVQPILPLNQPGKKPTVIVNFNQTEKDMEKPSNYDEKNNERFFPWSANVYFDGKLVGNGVLLNQHWVIVEQSCVSLVLLQVDYISVVMGTLNNYLPVKSLHESIIQVDNIVKIPNSILALLHLAKPAQYSRFILPSFIPDKSDKSDLNSNCIAVAHNIIGQIKTIHLVTVTDRHCGKDFICYKMKKYNHVSCASGEDESLRSGVIMCQIEHNQWYPNSFFNLRRGLCDFEHITSVTPLYKYKTEIQKIIDSPFSDKKYVASSCKNGYRCPLGNCLNWSHVCDKKNDCRDGSDELPQQCQQKPLKECSKSEVTCANGNCIDKTNFCNHKNDCGDLTDEPSECTCYAYLKVTDPSKICDGIRNCWDKSDENPYLCKCQPNSFRCGSSNLCVPFDYACDKEKDCPHGEDEKYCHGLQHAVQNNDGYGEVIEQHYGVWQTKCFPKSEPPLRQEIEKICKNIGYASPSTVRARLIDDDDSIVGAEKNATIHRQERTVPIKGIIYNKFSPIKLNNILTIFIKPSKPIIKLIKWDATDHQNCFRLEIKCE